MLNPISKYSASTAKPVSDSGVTLPPAIEANVLQKLDCLDAAEQAIMSRLYGLNGYTIERKDEVAKSLGYGWISFETLLEGIRKKMELGPPPFRYLNVLYNRKTRTVSPTQVEVVKPTPVKVVKSPPVKVVKETRKPLSRAEKENLPLLKGEKSAVEARLYLLPRKSQTLIVRLYGLNGHPPETLKDISASDKIPYHQLAKQRNQELHEMNVTLPPVIYFKRLYWLAKFPVPEDQIKPVTLELLQERWPRFERRLEPKERKYLLLRFNITGNNPVSRSRPEVAKLLGINTKAETFEEHALCKLGLLLQITPRPFPIKRTINHTGFFNGNPTKEKAG